MYHEKIPQTGVSVHTGFPNPAIDASLKDLDLNKLLVPHSIATYFMRLESDEWRSLGMFRGDLLIIDRAVSANKHDLVIWWHEDNFAISRLGSIKKGAAVWGVVTSTVHQFKQLRTRK